MHNITKDFEFCYGHRVWTQTLDTELSCDQACKCRHLHGHQGKITLNLESHSLESGMVTDFHHLNWFKAWLDDNFDHKMIMDVSDPLLPTMLTSIFPFIAENWVHKECPSHDHMDFYYPDPNKYQKLAPHVIEMLEGLVLVEFIPTSENLSKFFFWHVQEMISKRQETFGMGVKIRSVTFQETPKTSASYTK